eukprot:g21010.t1
MQEMRLRTFLVTGDGKLQSLKQKDIWDVREWNAPSWEQRRRNREDGNGGVQEGDGGIGDGLGEFEVGMKGVSKVDKLFELLMGARSSVDTVINVTEEEEVVANHFNSPGDMSILGILQCHNDATRKLEEQHLIFRLGSPQPNGPTIEFTSFKISPPLASAR